jgi:hypothetical protein
MAQMRIVALGAGLVLATGVAVAVAGTPFGGDDFGTIPSNKDTLKCEQSIDKAVGKAVGCIGKCTASEASGKLANDAAEDMCEKNNAGKSCLEKFAASVTKAKTKDTSGGCNCVNGSAISGIVESVLDGMNNTVYCDSTSGTPFGGDDTGFIPVAKSATAKCEASVAKAVSKAVACVIKCHASRASGKLADDTAEDACEKNNAGKSCLEKFTASVTKAQAGDTSGGCNCVSGTGLAGTIESQLDINSALTYCASPSGAFLN